MEFIVKIEKIINDGMGLARPAGSKIIMVPGVLPGETVNVSLKKEFRGYIKTELVEIISASAARITPPCPWYSECGGCDLQHADYETQLSIKSKFLSEALTRAGVDSKVITPIATLASPAQLNYRYRIRLKIDKNGKIGFFKKNTHSIVAITNCPIATEKINAALACLQKNPQIQSAISKYNELELLHSPAGDTITLLIYAEQNNHSDPELLTALTDCPEIDQADFIIQGRLHNDSTMAPLSQHFELLPPQVNNPLSYTLSWAADCFSQVNSRQNARLVELVCNLAGDVHKKAVLDLYCGMGNFSIALALCGAAVTGIEHNRQSIHWAKRNALAAGVDCLFFSADVHSSLKELAKDQQAIDTIILDPPRKGVGQATRFMAKLNARQILYISCDPATLARDLALLCKNSYQLNQLMPVDMFPQTHHIESVALLKRN